MKIFRFKKIDSTNTTAFRYAEAGAPSGSVFVADYQSKGRGKWGRRWMSPKGKDLLFSLLLKPKRPASQAPAVTQIACRSVAKVLRRELRLETEFKRPNDVLVQGRKICGILVESKGKSNGVLEALVVGVGLNVNSVGDELFRGAASIRSVTGRKASRAGLLKALLRQLKEDLVEW